MNLVNNISAVIFDCDGVMFDSRQANTNFYNHILSHFSLPPMNKKDAAFVHMHTAYESVKRIFRGTRYTDQAQEYRVKVDYAPFIKDMVIEPGLKKLLEDLKPGFGLAIATNRSNTIDNVLERNGIKEYFDIVVSSLDVKNPKPHPEPLFKILNFFDIRPDEAFYIGDSSIDYETARAADVHFISYRNRDLKTDYYIDYLADIEKFLTKP